MSSSSSAAAAKYWIRSDSGRVWGPYPLETLARINVGTDDPSQVHVSRDGRTFEPAANHPEVLERLTAAVTATQLARRAAAERAVREARAEAQLPPPPPPPSTPRVVEAPVIDLPGPPAEGSLETYSTINLYSRIAAQQLLGKLTIEGPDSRFEVIFKKGAPEQVIVSQAGASLAKFLVAHDTLTERSAERLIEDAGGPDADLLPIVLSHGIVAPQDLFPLLGKYALASLDRALAIEAGMFTWTAGIAPAPGSFTLGEKWSLLCEWCRKITGRVARHRLGARTGRAVYRADEPRVSLEALKLTAQEVRLIPMFDGTRSPVQIALDYPGESDMVYRTVLLLGDVAFLSFGPELKRPGASIDDILGAVEKVSAGAEPAAGPIDGVAFGKVALKSIAVAAPPVMARAPAEAAPAPVLTPAAPPPSPAAVLTPPVPVLTPAAPILTPSAPPPPSAIAPPAPGPAPTKPVSPPPPKEPIVPRSPPAAAKPPPAPQRPPGKIPTKTAKPAVVGDDLQSLLGLSETWKTANHFDVLGVERNAPTTTVKEAYFVLARKYHPDTVAESADAAMKTVKADLTARINGAYQVLGDDTSRKAYIRELNEGAKVDIGPILQAEEDFLRATILVKARKFPEAMDLLNRAIALNPNELEFLAWRAWSRFASAKDKRQEYDSAFSECARVARDNPRCVAAHLFGGQMAKIMGDGARAESAFKKVLEIEPNNIEAARELRMARR